MEAQSQRSASFCFGVYVLLMKRLKFTNPTIKLVVHLFGQITLRCSTFEWQSCILLNECCVLEADRVVPSSFFFFPPRLSLVGVGGVTSWLMVASSVPWRRRMWKQSAEPFWPTACCIIVATRISRASSGTWSPQVKTEPPRHWPTTLVTHSYIPDYTVDTLYILYEPI